jgi:3-oxoadipyl-CoA thiolase
MTTNDSHAYILGFARTPIGRYGGALSTLRADDLAAAPIQALMKRHEGVDWSMVDEVYYGAANQSGEDNRNIARMASLLAGLPESVPGATVNRLCGSGMEAVAQAARGVMSGELAFAIAGGSESMSRAPFVIPKADKAFPTAAEIASTTLGWRLVNPKMHALGHTEALGITAENVAAEHGVSRADQDAFALQSQVRAVAAQQSGFFEGEIIGVSVGAGKKAAMVTVDEHPRADTTLEALAALRPAFTTDGTGTVTAGNSSGINDGAAALLIGNSAIAERFGLQKLARIVGCASAGVAPRVMGIGPVPATQKLLHRLGLSIADLEVIELNEAFAAQSLACTRALGIEDGSTKINANGGAIALGHPLGMSGARLVGTAARQLQKVDGRYALASMCIGVGQGISLILERP